MRKLAIVWAPFAQFSVVVENILGGELWELWKYGIVESVLGVYLLRNMDPIRDFKFAVEQTVLLFMLWWQPKRYVVRFIWAPCCTVYKKWSTEEGKADRKHM